MSPYIFAFVVVLLWGSSASVSKLLLQDVSPYQVMFFSGIFCCLGLLAIIAKQGKLGLLRPYIREGWLHFLSLGLLGACVYRVCLFGAFERMPVQEAFIVNYLWPMMAVLFGILLLGESRSPWKLLGVGCSFFGVIIVLTKGELHQLQFEQPLGVALAVASALSYGLFTALVKRASYDKFVSCLLYQFVALMAVSLILLVESPDTFVTSAHVAGCLWLGIACNALGFLLWFLALKLADTGSLAGVIYLTPFCSLLYAQVLLGEQIRMASVVGLGFIVLGAFLPPVVRFTSRVLFSGAYERVFAS